MNNGDNYEEEYLILNKILVIFSDNSEINNESVFVYVVLILCWF